MSDESDTFTLKKFSYIATRGGKEYSGTLEARDRFAVYARVRAEGAEIVSLRKAGGSPLSFAGFKELNEKFSTIKEADKIIFTRNLAAMLGAGLSVVRALAVAQRQTRNPKLKYVLRTVSSSVRKGDTLHNAFAQHRDVFPDLLIAMVHAGEEGGNLPEALKVIATQMDKSYKLKKRIKGAMVYPAIVMLAMVLIGFLMMTEVVPTLKKTFGELGTDLPATTQAIISVSDLLIEHTVTFIIGLIFAISSFIYALRTPTGKRAFDTVLLYTPIIGGLVKEINAARFARTLSSLLSSGVDIVKALSITADVVQNTYHKEVIRKAGKSVSGGGKLSEVFMRRDDLFPPLVGEMLAVGEETGDISKMLTDVANFYEEEVDQQTKDMSTVIEPFLMLFIGAGVGFFAMAMIAPIYSLGDAI